MEGENMEKILKAKESREIKAVAKKAENEDSLSNLKSFFKFPVAVLGASGLVGQHFVRMLSDHPLFDLTLITCSDKNASQRFGDLPPISYRAVFPDSDLAESIKRLQLQETKPEVLSNSGVKIIFSALPATVAGPVESELRRLGFAVFTNSSSHRLDQDVPILIPEVNSEHLGLIKIQKAKYGGFIVAGSNCCVAGLVISLKPVLRWGIKRITVTTFQSISGAGEYGLAATEMAGNLLPLIKDEEEKITHETKKVLGYRQQQEVVPQAFQVHASCVRVPIYLGHLLDVEVEFMEKPSLEEVRKAMIEQNGLEKLSLPSASWPVLILRPEPDRPQPAYDLWAGAPARARGMAVSLGRLRQVNGSIRYFLLTNNLIRGAAGNCLLAAEYCFKLGLLN